MAETQNLAAVLKKVNDLVLVCFDQNSDRISHTLLRRLAQSQLLNQMVLFDCAIGIDDLTNFVEVLVNVKSVGICGSDVHYWV
jgi:hypothetical protein